MTRLATALRELHRIHQQLGDLHDRLRRGPKQVEARRGNVARLEQALADAQAELKASRVTVDQKQLLLKSSEAKVAELKVKLNTASSNREYQALKEQIAATEMAASVLADEILEALELVDDFQRKIAEAQENVGKGKEELARTSEAVSAKEGELKSEVARLEAELRETEEVLPVDARDAYQRMVKSRGSDCMARVEGDSCGGCFQQLTPNAQNSLRLGQMVVCGSCGRLLYLPEDRSVAGTS